MHEIDRDADRRIRLAAFRRVEQLQETYGGAIPGAELRAGFEIDGRRIPLLMQQGIVKPRGMDLALVITTSFRDPYGDVVSDEGFIEYHYQGNDPRRYDNLAVTRAGLEGVPLLYLRGIGHARYQAFWPAFVHEDDPASLRWLVAIDDPQVLRPDLTPAVVDEAHRRYTTQLARRRLHQSLFRERVLDAYGSRCTICRLRHRELLDAAHIVADSDPRGIAAVSNGLALCKIHHSAFDVNIIGIRPDCVVQVRTDVLEEADGPMLRHGIQELHGQRLLLPHRPAHRPRPDLLEVRYEQFRAAS